MTKFEREYHEILSGNGCEREILEARRNELKRIEREGKTCKNSFRMQALAQEYAARKREYDALVELV